MRIIGASALRDGGFDVELAHHGHGKRPEHAERAAPPAEPSPFARVLAGLGRECDRGEKLVEKAVGSGKELGNVELLALQAGVYRYSEAVDLSAKLVDRATNGVKTVLQGQ
ncbi:MAG: hypothetical protein KIT84_21015 [Labilithrix sp.]|nr:hypothetical protein [Labilithrix sp.]MCW5813524.1 hypothetical protein [Labilithrix sp.]